MLGIVTSATQSDRALSRARRLVFEASRPAKRAPGARSLRARPVATRRCAPRSSPSPLNYTDRSGFSAQASEDAAIGVGAGFFTGLVAHFLTSGGAGGTSAAGVGASSAGAASAGSGAVAAGAGAASAATALAAAGVGAGIASSIAGNVIASGHQPTSQIVSTQPSTRSATAAGTGTAPVGRTSFATMATSPVQEGRPPGTSLFDPERGALAEVTARYNTTTGSLTVTDDDTG